jgi:CDP-diacylglycerol--serine O-phosphatidyltransferase
MKDSAHSLVWIPSCLTAANIGLGFGSMLAAAQGRFEMAVYMLYFAVLLDVLDGKVARLLHATSEFGKELDSFSDAISFGAAPAFLVYQAGLSELGVAGIGACVAYLLAGVLRLARFNVTSNAHGKDSRSVGVPIPVAAGYLMAATLMRDRMPSSVIAIVVVFMALAMVSKWSLPMIKGMGPATTLILLAMVAYTFVVIRPSWLTIIAWNLCCFFAALAARAENRAREAASPPRPLGA